ncbi:MAG: DUF11 domain-containing protein, partial [Deltaproteobacteria bacterium]|nr:DUF11 domain-containing protein [Deltaproteobacteria bacterium]
MRTTLNPRVLLVAALALATACDSQSETRQPDPLGQVRQSVNVAFPANSIIIPMDTALQDNGTLRAFGMVHRLLRANIPVHRIALAGKVLGAVDFNVTTRPLGTADVPAARNFRGGPFVIDAAQRAAAIVEINAFLAAHPTPVVVVHEATAAFSADSQIELMAAPRIAVLQDNYEAIAFNYLNSARIPDSTGALWSVASPGMITVAQLAGPGASGVNDGALLSGSVTQFDHLSIQHAGLIPTDEAVREIRHWLGLTAASHLHAQCSGITAVENNGNGRLITTGGFTGSNRGASDAIHDAPDHLLAQIDGTFRVDSGAVDSLNLAAGSTYRANSRILIRRSDSGGAQARVAWVTGFMDGLTTNGFVTYLGGHDYGAALPISSNPLTNGARLFLDSLFTGGVAASTTQPNLTVTKSGAAFTSGNSITYTIKVTNAGPGTALSASLVDPIPAGSTFSSASGGGIFAAPNVTWTLGNLVSGASLSLTVTVTVASDGAYPNAATLSYSVGATPKTLVSNTFTTTRDTVVPDTSIVSGPSGTVASTSAIFDFASPEAGVTFECRLDGAATFTACTDPVTFSGLAQGSHTLEVRARDGAGNVDATPASRTWTVDTVAPDTSIVSGPSGTVASTSAAFDFGSPEAGVTFECRLDGAATFTACTDPVTFNALAQGAHTLEVRAVDAAGNADPTPASRSWAVDTVAPDTSIMSGPSGSVSSASATFDFGSPEAGVTFECRLDGAATFT